MPVTTPPARAAHGATRLARRWTVWASALGWVWLAALALPAGTAAGATLDVQVLGADGRPIAEAVAWLEGPAAHQVARPPLQEIEQKDRQFTQRVSVVPVGTAIDFPNRDRVRHHVYSVSPAKIFDLKLYIGRPANPVLFDRAGVAVLGCNIHDEMLAWVVVVPTAHFGQSPASGQIRLADVPAGAYQLLVWHPDLPIGARAHAQTVTLAAGDQAVKVRLAVQGY